MTRLDKVISPSTQRPPDTAQDTDLEKKKDTDFNFGDHTQLTLNS